MRLTELRLQRYGPFEDIVLDLDPAPGRLNIICAPNGAGKSVLRQAFVDLLFGIGGQSPMGFRYGYPGMKLLATVATESGPVSFGRRKGLGGTWIDAGGTALETPPIANAFRHTDARALERLFALDSERLRSGGAELLADDGAMAEALLGASGLTGARKLLKSLTERADLLAPQRRTSQRPFYVAVDEMLAASKAAKAALLRPEAWERLVAEQHTAETTHAAQRAAALDAERQATRLQRIRRVRTNLAAHDAALAWLAANPEAPDLPASAAARLAEAWQKRAAAEQKLADETARHGDLHTQLAAVPPDPALLAEGEMIDQLAEQTGKVDAALEHIPLREAELAQLRHRIATRLQRLGATLPPEQAATLLPTRALESRARSLITAAAAHTQALAATTRLMDEAAAKIAETEAQLATLPPAAQTGALTTLLAEIRAGGDPAALSGRARHTARPRHRPTRPRPGHRAVLVARRRGPARPHPGAAIVMRSNAPRPGPGRNPARPARSCHGRRHFARRSSPGRAGIPGRRRPDPRSRGRRRRAPPPR